LVLAGGYDHRVMENVVYHKELVKLAGELGLKTATTKTIVTALNVPDDVDVLFLLSVPNTLKEMLLNSARLLVYTPSNEHFGIVPLEAMLAGVPVLAANTGGPLETVVEGKTGWLCPPDDVEKWTQVMNKVLHRMSEDDVKKMGNAGKERVKSEFSDVKMAERIDGLIDGMANSTRKGTVELSLFLMTIVMVLLDVVYFAAKQRKLLGEKLEKMSLPPFVLTLVSIISWAVYLVVGLQTKSSQQKSKKR
jgi:alpha-1,3/alpha-1,6-mannosyltransferase